MSVKKILVNSLWFGIVPKLSMVLNVLLLPIITPYLSPHDYGIWGMIVSYISIITSVTALGLNVHLTNSFFEYRSKFYLLWQRIFFLLIISSVFFSICAVSLLMFVLKGDISGYKIILVSILSSFPILFSSNALIANHLFVVRSEPKPLVLRILIANILGLTTMFVAIYYFKLGYLGFVLNAAVATILSFIFFIKPLWLKEKIYPVIESNYSRIKYLLKISFPIIPHTLGFMLLSSSSRIIMSFYGVSMDEIGLFSNGYIMGDYITIISAAVAIALTAQMQESFRAGNYIKFRKLYYFSQTISLFAIILFSAWMPEIYKILIRNEQLQTASSIARYICFANAVFPLYAFMSTIAFIQKKTQKVLYLVFVPGILNIMICMIFIPMYGYKVAVFSSIISYWSQIFIPFLNGYFKKTTYIWLGKAYKLFLLFVLLLSSIIVVNIMANLQIYIKIIFSVGFVLMFLFLIKKFRILQVEL